MSDEWQKSNIQLAYLSGDTIDTICRREGLTWKAVAEICNHPWARPPHIDEQGGIVFDVNGQPLGLDLQGGPRVVGVD